MEVKPISKESSYPEFFSVQLNCSKGHTFQEDFGKNSEREVQCPRCGEKAIVQVVDREVTIKKDE